MCNGFQMLWITASADITLVAYNFSLGNLSIRQIIGETMCAPWLLIYGNNTIAIDTKNTIPE
jgi:hypothetical protein